MRSVQAVAFAQVLADGDGDILLGRLNYVGTESVRIEADQPTFDMV